jgi:hypothetical protein
VARSIAYQKRNVPPSAPRHAEPPREGERERRLRGVVGQHEEQVGRAAEPQHLAPREGRVKARHQPRERGRVDRQPHEREGDRRGEEARPVRAPERARRRPEVDAQEHGPEQRGGGEPGREPEERAPRAHDARNPMP